MLFKVNPKPTHCPLPTTPLDMALPWLSLGCLPPATPDNTFQNSWVSPGVGTTPAHPSGGFPRVWDARLGLRGLCPPGKCGRALLRSMCVCTRVHTRLCALSGFGCTSARRPPGSWWGQKVLTGKTMAKREIQLVQGLVPISQPLNAKGAERMGGRGRAFYCIFPFILGGFLAPSLPPA